MTGHFFGDDANQPDDDQPDWTADPGYWGSLKADEPPDDGGWDRWADTPPAPQPTGTQDAQPAADQADQTRRTEGWTERFQHSNMQGTHLAERVAREHLAGKFHAWGRNAWAHWDGQRWDTATTETTVRRAVRDALHLIHHAEVLKADRRRDVLLADAATTDDNNTAKDNIAAANRAHADRMRQLATLFNGGKVDEVMKLARGFLEVKLADFDQHPDLLTVGNGVIDLRTGALGPHDPELMLTKMTPVDYQPGARHGDWDTALTALPEDALDWMHRRFGQGITGHPPEDDVVPFLYGPQGGNGKSTILAGLTAACGEHVTTVQHKLLVGNPSDHPTERMHLRGARLAFLEELPDGDFLDMGKLKPITGVTKITARAIGQDNTEFNASHSLIVTTNHDLQVRTTDGGTWRRLALVTFPYSFVGRYQNRPGDPQLRPRITAGRDGQHEAILAWVVEGARLWYASGRIIGPLPASVQRATDDWAKASNDAARFLTESLVLDPDAAVLSAEVYAEFKDWMLGRGKKPMADQTFWQRAGVHEWFTSGDVAKKKDRAAAWSLSRRAASWTTPAPAQAILLTGVRWRQHFDDGEVV